MKSLNRISDALAHPKTPLKDAVTTGQVTVDMNPIAGRLMVPALLLTMGLSPGLSACSEEPENAQTGGIELILQGLEQEDFEETADLLFVTPGSCP